MPTTTPVSRRELNKERTRAAIKDAVMTLSRTQPITTLTADDIAAQAGISRRTFFNYYAGLDAVLVEATLEPLAEVVELFLARPPAEDPLTAMIAALSRPVPLELARWSAALCGEDTQRTEVFAQVWQLHTRWLQDMLRVRLGEEADPMYVAGLAGTVIAAFSAAEAEWMARTEGRLDTGSLELFSALVRTALQHAREGWRAPHTPAGP